MPDFVGFRTKRRDLLIFTATLSLPPPDKSACAYPFSSTRYNCL